MFKQNRFRAQLALRGVTLKELAEMLGISEPTVYRKINRNGDFAREEIEKMIRILRIENPMHIFFSDEDTET